MSIAALLSAFFSVIADSTWGLLLWAIGFFIVFGILERITPCNRGQKLYGRGMLTDAGYFFVMPIFGRMVRIIYISISVMILFHGSSDQEVYYYVTHGFGPMAKLPLWLQSAIVFLLSDVLLYWTHRFFHKRKLWNFHAIHHSSTPVGWHSTYRFHPVNVWLSFTLVDSLMLFLGFSVEAVSLMAAFNMIYSAMVHANLNWTFGPFKYLFASPVFHRWHHTSQEEGMDKNFAPTFPLLDIVFGTFYMPENTLPEHYGVPGGDIPESFLRQMVWPFKKR